MDDAPYEQAEETVIEVERIHTPTMLFSGECDHVWTPRGQDQDGMYRYQCAKCPMGKMLNENENRDFLLKQPLTY